MNKFKIILTSVLLIFFVSNMSMAQKMNRGTKSKKETKKPKAFHLHQHVMVTMKDGSQIEAVVHSHVSKKKYWVRQWHSGREGAVHEKYMRALSDGEITELQKSKKK